MLKTQGLTGIAYVELGGGSADSPPCPPARRNPTLNRTKPSLSARLENVLTSVLAKLDRTSSNIDAMLNSDNQAALKSALADMATVSRTIAARKDVIDKGILNAALTAENSARVTAQLGPALTRISRAADAVEKMGDDVSKAGTSTARTVGAVGATCSDSRPIPCPRFSACSAK